MVHVHVPVPCDLILFPVDFHGDGMDDELDSSILYFFGTESGLAQYVCLSHLGDMSTIFSVANLKAIVHS